MAKDADLQKIQLKVSINCCDGCKKKVKKVLRNTEGVLKADIDPLQSKVTVLGNIDAQLLIKKLKKAGKQAELLSNDHQKNEDDIPKTRKKEKSSYRWEQEQEVISCDTTNDKSIGESARDKNLKKDAKKRNIIEIPTNPEAIKQAHDLPPSTEGDRSMYSTKMNDMVTLTSYTQYPSMAEPYAIAIPCYAVSSSRAAVYPTCYGQEYHQYERPTNQLEYQSPSLRATDYFSDDNTIGCYVM